ncbi:hypothetical protein DH2020_000257 [Rehmannia glutinosa]|uniref:Uncharacterized protein n=1 Tax=Rehmannia glutinosa TaxID=99300 RepID=A0ABR0XWE7_REHGL
MGVDTATIGDGHRIITVVGKVDPVKLRERLEKKTHKKVELVSPQPKKDGNKENGKGKDNNNGGDDGKQEKKKESKDKNSKNKSDEKKTKEKELPVTTAVLRVQLHWYQDMKIDKQKELVTVTGAMDMTTLAAVLKKHLKKEVEILPPKKEADKKEKGGGEKGKGVGEKGKSGGGEKGKSGGGGGGDGGEKVAGSEKSDGNKVQFQVGYPYPLMFGPGGVVEQFQYNPSAFVPYHAPQLFSDENPNACSVM